MVNTQKKNPLNIIINGLLPYKTKRKHMNNTISSEFMNKLKAEKNNLTVPRSNKILQTTANKIVTQVQQEYNLNDTEEAFAVIAVFVQQGATARNCDGNMTIKIFDAIVKLSSLRKIFNANGAKNGIRKFAKTYAAKFLEITTALELPGNLYSKVIRLNPDRFFTIKEKAALSDYQSANEDLSSEIRALIQGTFKSNTDKNPKR